MAPIPADYVSGTSLKNAKKPGIYSDGTLPSTVVQGGKRLHGRRPVTSISIETTDLHISSMEVRKIDTVEGKRWEVTVVYVDDDQMEVSRSRHKTPLYTDLTTATAAAQEIAAYLNRHLMPKLPIEVWVVE